MHTKNVEEKGDMAKDLKIHPKAGMLTSRYYDVFCIEDTAKLTSWFGARQNANKTANNAPPLKTGVSALARISCHPDFSRSPMKGSSF